MDRPAAVTTSPTAPMDPGPARPVGPPIHLVLGVALVGASVLMTLGARRARGSVAVLVALFAAVTAIFWLSQAAKRYGLFSVGGITCAMVAILFIGRWFFPPVAPGFITPLAAAYYDRNGAFMASSLMIVVFTITYSFGGRRPTLYGGDRNAAKRSNATSGSVADLAAASVLLMGARLATGLLLHVGVPGRQAVSVPLVGIIYYASSYGPLAGAALILWSSRESRASSLTAGAILLCDVLVESLLGSHGTAFLAILVFGSARAAGGRPIRMTTARAASISLLMSVVVTAALLISFVARESLNGGMRQSLGDVPTFIANRFGGLEYVAPVIGAVNHTGSDTRNLRTSKWNRYMTADVYGLPPETHTGFASTAVGWWYGIKRFQGVALGAAISGFFASWFDGWCYGPGRHRTLLSATVAIGGLLGWATFLLGGTIGSLGGISIGYIGIALALALGHRLVSQASPHQGLPGVRGTTDCL